MIKKKKKNVAHHVTGRSIAPLAAPQNTTSRISRLADRAALRRRHGTTPADSACTCAASCPAPGDRTLPRLRSLFAAVAAMRALPGRETGDELSIPPRWSKS